MGSFHWALLVFIYLRFVFSLGVHVAGDLNQKNIVRSRRSPDFVRSRFTQAHLLEPEMYSATRHF